MSTSDRLIRVRGLSKSYRVGTGPAATTMGEAVWQRIRGMGRWGARGGNGVPSESKARPGESAETFWALKDVGFDVRAGEVVGVVGRNGAGKSTLLKLLGRVAEPSEGQVDLWGRVGSLLEVGTGFHPELTGRENIYLNGAILGMRRHEIKQRFDEIVAFSGVERFLDTPVKRYSSGMYVRLAFAVAAHLDAEVLVVDEVLAVGDAEFQKKCMGKIRDAARGGRTILFVSHNLPAVRSLCTRAILLSQGKAIWDGDVEGCLRLYGEDLCVARKAKWVRSEAPDGLSLAIQSVEADMQGQQPNHRLVIKTILETLKPHRPAFAAVDIFHSSGTPVLQAEPKRVGFITDGHRQHEMSIDIDLPPLIPGEYRASVWVGTHNTETLDHVHEVVMFEVHTSPAADRTYPHTPNHGCVFAGCDVMYTPVLSNTAG